MAHGQAFVAAGRSGVYRPDSPIDVAAVDKAAQEKGYCFSHIDGSTARTSRDLLPVIGDALRFPDYFGNNWDALADLLHDFSWLASNGYAGQVIVLSHIDHLRDEDPSGYETLTAVLHHAAAFGQDFQDAMPFIVLIAS